MKSLLTSMFLAISVIGCGAAEGPFDEKPGATPPSANDKGGAGSVSQRPSWPIRRSRRSLRT
jgi:hypothetical protein